MLTAYNLWCLLPTKVQRAVGSLRTRPLLFVRVCLERDERHTCSCPPVRFMVGKRVECCCSSVVCGVVLWCFLECFLNETQPLVSHLFIGDVAPIPPLPSSHRAQQYGGAFSKNTRRATTIRVYSRRRSAQVFDGQKPPLVRPRYRLLCNHGGGVYRSENMREQRLLRW